MATRRDQLHSYQFMTQRVISAFVMRETDPQQSPLRRGIGALFGGLMVAILVAAGFGIYGLITKVGADRWQADGAVVIEKETGASFVYFAGTLHPTLNYASAVLAAGRPSPPVFRVAANSLSAAPRGTTVGIAGAPNSLPSVKRHVGLPWTMCAIPGTNEAGKGVSGVAVAIATAPQGGQTLADDAVLVRDARLGSQFLIWHGRRHQVHAPEALVPALFGAATQVPVGTAWLNALPAGGDIQPINVGGRGEPSPAMPGRSIGDVLSTETGSGKQYHLVFGDGLAPITALQRDILRAASSAEAIPVSVAEANAAPRSGQLQAPAGEVQPPAATPTLTRPGGSDSLCAVTTDAATPPTLRVGGNLPGIEAAVPTSAVSADGVPFADLVLVPAGRVTTVRVLGSPTAQAGPYYVITDLGIKYPVPQAAVLPMLGYQPAQAVDVPASLVSRIPTGPTLDPAAALQPAAVNGS
ncbi:type VII secretion protein EccB [Micromonospora sp. NBC_01796]|uniref:type VII secretion protein EccB n=1 Tax=Micromonospora sp. NBC_01796 TaxID=2975987 RepID=UPI002DD9BF34|nr:type VII secretion protein EccB [Micromonospora sp. NBC_01796]WSA85064.1 type VII secretion protein EccB [Micromonospora sp. NBC_01796]